MVAKIREKIRGVLGGENRLADRSRWPRSWWYPERKEIHFDDEDEKKQRHEELSKAIRNNMIGFIALSLFCMATLGLPDAKLFEQNFALELPIAKVKVDFGAFVMMGPLLIVAYMAYLHTLLGTWIQIWLPQSGRVPYIFNIQSKAAHISTAMVMYMLPPFVLGLFAWKSLPLLQGELEFAFFFLVFLTTFFLFFLSIRRHDPRLRKSWPYKVKWVGLLAFTVSSIVLAYQHEPDRKEGLLTRHWNLKYANLNEAQMAGRDLSFAEMSYANLKKARLVRTDLSEAILSGGNLDKANLQGAKLQRAKLEKANLQGADLQRADLQGANLFWANLQGTKLQEAKLQWAELRRADLQGANLFWANLQGTNLQGANLSGVDLRDVKGLKPEQLKHACGDKKTKLPDGSKIQLQECPPEEDEKPKNNEKKPEP